MLYHVTRNGQNYGPYTLEDLQRYVASGNVLPTDLAKSDEMPELVPVAQLLGAPASAASYAAAAPPAAAAPYAGGAEPYAGATMPAYMAGGPYPDPPNLHWGLVLLIDIFTCGLFAIVWDIVQSAWMRKVNPRSNALFLYIAETVVALLGGLGRGLLIFSSALHGGHMTYPLLGFVLFVAGITLLELARFDMRRSMEQHFNGPEPIGLSLSGVMTFFFGVLYFQYHFTRINELKRLARYRGAAI